MACLTRLGPVMYSPSGQCIPCTDPPSIMHFDGTVLQIYFTNHITNVMTFFFQQKQLFFALIYPHIFQNGIGNSSGFLLSVNTNKFSNMSVLLVLFQLLE